MNKGGGRFVLIGGLLFLLGSLSWVIWRGTGMEEKGGLLGLEARRAIVGKEAEEEAEGGRLVEAKDWTAPIHQTGGKDWVFEVFTPPLIYYDVGAKRFKVESPVVDRSEEERGIKLLSIERPKYRLQYRGYVDGRAGYLIEIEDIETGDWYRGKEGDNFPESEFSIEGFEAERVFVSSDEGEGTPYVDYPIRLRIWDERGQVRVEIKSEEHYVEGYWAELKLSGGIIQGVKTGDVFEVKGMTYTVVRITADELIIEKVEARGEEPISLKIEATEKRKKNDEL